MWLATWFSGGPLAARVVHPGIPSDTVWDDPIFPPDEKGLTTTNTTAAMYRTIL